MYRSELKKKVISELKKGSAILYDDYVWRNKNGEILRQKGLGLNFVVPANLIDYYLCIDHLNEDDICIIRKS